jgi:glycosyltransferase involved in cell wall biosynthesis
MEDKKPGYVFLSNSTKPTNEENNSRGDIKLSNVSRPCLEAALGMGYEVFFGVNRAKPENLKCDLPVHLYDSHTYRSITAFSDNKVAYDNLCEIVKNNDIQVIHCNTPVGGMIGRLVGKKYHVPKVIYTAHGFHFYKGAPLFNNTILKWAEAIMAHWTNAIITMNQEDYEAAQKFHLKKNGHIYKVHGVGINCKDYENINVNREAYRRGLGLEDDDFVCIASGDLVKRKNYQVAIRAIAEIKNTHIKYLICGKGPEDKNLKKLVNELGINKQVHFLGFRTDIKELLAISDCFFFASLQEGLPRSTMEAMASGLPVVCSAIRGNTDLIDDGKGGFMFCPKSPEEAATALVRLMNSNFKMMGKYNLNKVREYDISVVKDEIKNIYKQEITQLVN